MFCANCGTKNEDGAAFCANCGQKLDTPAAPVAPASEVKAEPAPAPVAEPAKEEVKAEAPAAPAKVEPKVETPAAEAVKEEANAPKPVKPEVVEGEAKKSGFKPAYIGIIAGCVCALIVIIVIIANVAGKSGGNKITQVVSAWYDSEDDETYILVNNKPVKSTIEGSAKVVKSNADDTVVLLKNGSELYVLDKKGNINMITDSVDSYDLSADGSTVAYIEDEILYLYSVKNGKVKKVEEDVKADSVILSPSGKAVAFLLESKDDYKLAVNNGKKTVELQKNVKPLALSDNCKFIYYYDQGKNALYVNSLKDDSSKISGDVNGFYLFNKDCTEVIFSTENGLYYSAKGADKQKLTSYTGSAVPLFARAGGAYTSDPNGVTTVEMDTLLMNYYFVDNSLYYYNKKCESDKAISNVYNLLVSDDLKTVYYVNYDNTLYFTKLDGKYENNKVKSDIKNFSITRDGSAAYFVDDDDTLYYAKGKKDPKKISDDVDKMAMTYDDTCLFLVDMGTYAGTLYSSTNGSNKDKVKDEVMNVVTRRGATYMYADYDSSDNIYDVYVATKGAKFSIIFEELNKQ